MIGRFIFDNELETFLSRNSYDKIAMLLLNGGSHLINEVGNFILRGEGDTVSYVPKSKINDDDDPWGEKSRVTIKIGRFANKFLKKNTFQEFNITPTDIEQFVNLYKSYFIRDKVNFQVVSGEDIYTWYCYTSYFHNNGNTFGSLWNSCMRQIERNKFMKLYADNPNDIKLLIMLTDDGKLLGRALLWDNILDQKSDKVYKVMDRIYTIYDHDVINFKNWAKDNGYIHKLEQSARSEVLFTEYKDGQQHATSKYLYSKLLNHKLRYYPYLDTFKFYDPLTGTFSNNDMYSVFEYVLVQSNGDVVPPPPPEEEIIDDSEEEPIYWNDL